MAARREDPLLRSARREALYVLVMWLGALAYTVGYCARYGYGRSADDLQFVLGFPDWVFWGIVVPWAVCIALSSLLAFGIMADADLGEEADAEAGSAAREAGDG